VRLMHTSNALPWSLRMLLTHPSISDLRPGPLPSHLISVSHPRRVA